MVEQGFQVCACGRIHFYKKSTLEKLVESGKQLAIVCKNCGTIFKIGKAQEKESISSECSAEHTYTVEVLHEKEIDVTNELHIGKVIIDDGVSIRMLTGHLADNFDGKQFHDIGSVSILPSDYDKEYDTLRNQVNMYSTYSRLTSEQLNAVSKSNMAQFNWEGTAFNELDSLSE